MEALGRIVEGHGFLHRAVVEMGLAAAVHGDEDELGWRWP